MDTMPKGRQQNIVTRMAHTRWFGTCGGGPAAGSEVRLPPQALQNFAQSKFSSPQFGQYTHVSPVHSRVSPQFTVDCRRTLYLAGANATPWLRWPRRIVAKTRSPRRSSQFQSQMQPTPTSLRSEKPDAHRLRRQRRVSHSPARRRRWRRCRKDRQQKIVTRMAHTRWFGK